MSDEFEKLFQQITEVVLGRKLTGVMDYERYFKQYVGESLNVKSAVSDTIVYVAPTPYFKAVKRGFVGHDESLDLAKLHIHEKEVEGLSLSNASRKLKDMIYLTPEAIVGENTNVVECYAYGLAHDCFRSGWLNQSKCMIFCFWPRQSEYAIGSYYLFASKFCINCYNSENLTRCFELSDCHNCADCLFCHNCEALSNCMFCFNTKSKRYAIGNVEVGRDKYLEIRKRMLDELVSKLEHDKKLDISIYNIGCR